MIRPPDEKRITDDWRPLIVLAALAVLVKVPTIGTPAFWDETAWLGQAGWLASNGLTGAMPGLRPDGQFFGHPPGLHLAVAVLFRVFGQSIEVAHVLIALLGAVGVCATYALVRTRHDAKTALLAALLLLLSPTWFSNAGMFLGDLPVAALGTLSAVLVMRGRLLAYCVVASAMVLIKEPAVALVAALVAWRILSRWPVSWASLRDALPYAAPLLAFIAFITAQKIASGQFFFILAFEADPLIDAGIAATLRDAAKITAWLFVAQFRWVLTLAIVLDLVVNREARRRPELLLCVLVALGSGYTFSVIYYMPRYVLPVLPFFYALGAVSLMSLARMPLRQQATGAAAVALTLWCLARDHLRGHGEDNLRYLGIVRAHQAAIAEIETRFAGARILATWPAAAELSDPLLGYVSRPLPVKWFAGATDLAEADLAVVASPANRDAARLETLLRDDGWVAVVTQRSGPAAIHAYRRR